MRTYGRWMILLCCFLGLVLPACIRSAPPDIPEFKPPKRVVKEVTEPGVVVDTSEPEPEIEKPEPKPEKPAPKVEAPPPPKPKPEPKKEAPKAPTLIGTWLVEDMSRNGQSQPMPDGMEITMTFAEGGTVTMSMSGGPMPEAQPHDGTYTLADGKITMSMENDSQTGTCTFEGDDRVTLDFEKAKMVLSRSG